MLKYHSTYVKLKLFSEKCNKYVKTATLYKRNAPFPEKQESITTSPVCH